MQQPAPAEPPASPASPQIGTLDTLAVQDAMRPLEGAEAVPPPQTHTEAPTAEPLGLERYMVQQDKLYVVAAVVLLIWFGLLFFLFRTDRRLARIERELDASDPA